VRESKKKEKSPRRGQRGVSRPSQGGHRPRKEEKKKRKERKDKRDLSKSQGGSKKGILSKKSLAKKKRAEALHRGIKKLKIFSAGKEGRGPHHRSYFVWGEQTS